MGPSPLTRGSRVVGRQLLVPLGSIPAHAGQPSSRTSLISPNRVHPRSRGAACRTRSRAVSSAGPSPLTRGSRVVCAGRDGDCGSIPAHAGQHRSRGGRDLDPGSIPAHAGQPSSTTCCPSGGGVHPRSRGAATQYASYSPTLGGPSPLTRGSPGRALLDLAGHGSIPAHAGQPRRRAAGSTDSWVHPRSRGAAVGVGYLTLRPEGPSPLTRGSRRGLGRQQAGQGSIPAHAGQPSDICGPPNGAGVHPRSRGAARPQMANLGAW